jgi:DNA helicase HerA-like ATPase
MFEAAEEDIPIHVDFDSLVRYHFGIFAFTGGGKGQHALQRSKKNSTPQKDVKVVIFDISCEYSFLFMDVFADASIPCMAKLSCSN